jgi:hypothetical protein
VVHLPSCLEALFAQCPLDSKCGTDASNTLCYPSGATAAPSSLGEACTNDPAGGVTYAVSKADGTPCYSLNTRSYPAQICEATALTWTDAAGNRVATGDLGYGGSFSFSCTGTSEKVSMQCAPLGQECVFTPFYDVTACSRNAPCPYPKP